MNILLKHTATCLDAYPYLASRNRQGLVMCFSVNFLFQNSCFLHRWIRSLKIEILSIAIMVVIGVDPKLVLQTY
ncbi:hypothetical protein Mapa_000892 [Marchantia paleacea]|nr:hypothetical protein Mapa_000892 [Marchantia paleacea]